MHRVTFLVVLCCCGSQAFAQQRHPLEGHWVVLNEDAATERRNAAVLSATEDMGVLVRLIARRRLRRGTPVHRRVEISIEGQRIETRVGPYHLSSNHGAQITYTDPIADEEMRARQTLREGVLTQTLVGEDATVTHTLRVNDQGRLVLTVRIASSRLPADVLFRIAYRRVTQ